MDTTKLYDADFLLWTEQQAQALRDLGPSNALDIVHLAEEIEDLGRRDLREVESFLELIYLHGMKLVAAPSAATVRHWTAEVVNFQTQLRRSFSLSMRQRLNLDVIWGDALRRFNVGPRPKSSDALIVAWTLSGHPSTLDALTAASFDIPEFLAAIEEKSLRGSAAQAPVQ